MAMAPRRSLTQAAEALDLSRRQVAYYANGERPVPRYVLLALKGWELERKAVAASSGQRATQSSSGGPSEGPPTISARIQSLPDRKTCF